jgi:glycosyltransferase involved in cell wall biosynthesis
MTASQPLISVIVPVFNQWDLVPKLLHCLGAQSFPGDRFEVLLVDNGSTNIPAADADLPFVRRLSCLAPGSYAARNHGVANAQGELLAFTDADCQPHPDWLSEIIAFMGSLKSEKNIIAGAVTMVPRNWDHMNLAELYDTMMGIPQANYVRRGYGVTANLTATKELVNRLGGFEARRFSGGDAEFCRRAVATGGATLHYCPKAIVYHPARDSMQALIAKVRRIKGGQLTAGPLRRRVEHAIMTFMPPTRAWRRTRRSTSFSRTQRFMVCLVQVRLWLAGMAEALRLMFGKRPERQ